MDDGAVLVNDHRVGDEDAVRPYGLSRAEINSSLIYRYLSHLSATGKLPAASIQQTVGVQPLAGHVAVVTGASSGIGAAIARALAQQGAHVAIGARRADKLSAVQADIAEHSSGDTKCIAVPTDVTDREQVNQLVERAEAELGPVTILVNNAGVMYFQRVTEVLYEEWERTVDVICKGTLHGVGAVLPKFVERGRGHIVNISSDAGRKVFPGLAVYSAAKFFVEALTQGIRLETASTGVRVTSIQPGNVATTLASMATDAEGVKLYGEPSGAKVLEPEDVARAVVYAVMQPEYVGVNEVLIEPREEPC